MRILLTGADGALGAVVARSFAQWGDEVVQLHGAGDGVGVGVHRAGNLADEAQAKAVIDKAAGQNGFDAVIHLVGAFRWIPVTEVAVSDLRQLFSANVETALSTVKAALPHLRDGGSIVLVGANAAQPAGAGFAAYAAAKSGVARLGEALAAELKPRGIRANTIMPSIIDTPANRKDMPDADFGAWTSPQAIAEVLRFLASDASRAITGASIPVTNGG